MNSGSVLKDALIVVRRSLKARGFSSKASRFHRTVDGGNTIVLSVQKSMKSTPAEALVTFNYGVYSARIGMAVQDEPSAAFDVWRSHWRKRLTQDGQKQWLRVNATDYVDNSAQVLAEAVERVLSDLFDHASDAALCNEWLSGSSPGITNLQRLILLSILLNEIGPADKFEHVMQELRSLVAGGIHKGIVERELADAGIKLAP